MIMAIAVNSIQLFKLQPWMTLIVQVLTGILCYFIIAKSIKLECLEYIQSTINDIFKNRRVNA